METLEFGRIIARSVASLDEFGTKHEQNQVRKLEGFFKAFIP
jgi:hypothetical protein